MFQESDFRWVEGGVILGKNWFKRNIVFEVSKLKSFREKYNNTGVYVTAYLYNKKEQDEAELYGNMYLDFDSESSEIGYEHVRQDVIRAISFFSAIFGISEEQIRIFFSGKKGIHLVIPAKTIGVKPDKELNEIFKLIAIDIKNTSAHKTVDTGIYDRMRMWRLPNSKHQDTGLYKVPMTYQQLIEMDYEEVKRWAKRPRKIRFPKPKYNPKAHRVYQEYVQQWEREKKERLSKKHGERKLNFCPPCIKALLTEIAPEGKRNNTIAALASYYKQRGYSEERAFKRLCRWNSKYCSPPLKEKEIERTVQSIYRGPYVYGCSTLAELSGACDKENCKIGKNKK